MDKKTLKREYKESQRPMGVYQIGNTVSGRWLVGSSTDLPSILNRHRAQLRFGSHPNRALQKDWSELGADAFSFEVLDTLAPPEEMPGYDPKEDLRVLEAIWIEKLSADETPSYDTK